MNRRASLPGADELFRPTGAPPAPAAAPAAAGLPAAGPTRPVQAVPDPPSAEPARTPPPRSSAERPEASGRVGHDQKITIYLSAQELLDLEQARLRLRAEFGLGIDRGRIVREAVSELLRDLHDAGPDSVIVRRLS